MTGASPRLTPPLTPSLTPSLTPWARARERGGSLPLRAMTWLSLRLSQGLGEAILLPITGWFLLTSPAARAASRDYLTRVLDRPARMTDIARHFFSFAQAILDRAFFLAGQAERYDIQVEGLEHLLPHIKAGRGCILLGAHLGSFDAMRALGRQAPVRVRPAMFRANAGALTAILERLDPALAARIIDIGRPEAMLQVREAIADGDLVAFLADRATDPRRLVAMPFLGAPARFPTGPFQIAAMLEAPLVLFHGIRAGRRRYVLRFEALPGDEGGNRAAALHQTMSAYVARLEAVCRAHPFQWFNFHDFWRPDPAVPTAPRSSPGRAVHRSLLLAALLSMVSGVPGSLVPPGFTFQGVFPSGQTHAAEDPSALLNTIMRMRAARPGHTNAFREEKTVPRVTRPLVSTGVLVYRRPDHMEKRTLSPIREDLAVDGRRASVTAGDSPPHVLDVDAHAELRVVIDTFLGVLSGDLARLRADFDVTAEGSPAQWRITLLPHGADARKLLRSATVTGQEAAIREIRLLLPGDHWDVMTVDAE